MKRPNQIEPVNRPVLEPWALAYSLPVRKQSSNWWQEASIGAGAGSAGRRLMAAPSQTVPAASAVPQQMTEKRLRTARSRLDLSRGLFTVDYVQVAIAPIWKECEYAIG